MFMIVETGAESMGFVKDKAKVTTEEQIQCFKILSIPQSDNILGLKCVISN